MAKADLIIYTDHIRLRLKLRLIPHDLPRQIYSKAIERYFDALTGHLIAIMKKELHGKTKEYALSYDEKGKIVELITIHPIRSLQKLARVKTGRWRKI